MAGVLDSLRSYSASGSSYSSGSRRSSKMKVYNLSESPAASKDFALEEDGCEDFMIMDVGQPVTITVREEGGKNESFTTYLIRLETNYPTFSKTFSAVRRRYSEFCWLRNHLRSSYPDEKIPPLPPKKYLRIINFHPSVIQGRCRGLSRFLQRVLETPSFLEDPVLVLFIQSDLEIEEIEKQKPIEINSEVDSLRAMKELEVSSEYRTVDNETTSEVEEYWKRHNTLHREDSIEESGEEDDDDEEEEASLIHDRIVHENPSPSSCISSGSVKTEDSGHFEDSGSTSSLDNKSLIDKKNTSNGDDCGDGTGQKIKCAKLPRKSEQLPPHRKLSLNDYMAFDPISRYLLQNPSLM